jgi:glucose-1-phosphate thymidylyltransferase
MKGVILAGGTGSRMLPMTKATNKHLLPVGGKPMIYHPIEKLTGAGINDILIVTGTEHMGNMISALGSGRDFGCEFTYRVQDEAGGIAQALGLARNFVGTESMCVLLGDNIFTDSLEVAVSRFDTQDDIEALVILKAVKDPGRFGVATLSENGERILSIEEKPSVPKSNLAVTGIYFYGPGVFDVVKTLKPSARGELEVTDINNHYVGKGKMGHYVMKGSWTDAGTHESYRAANNLMADIES